MLVAAPVALVAALASSCASTSGLPRPTPFPGAPAIVRGVLAVEAAPAAAAGVVTTALAQRGVPYQFGGTSPAEGFDCSGLVQYAFGQHRVAVPRTVAEQWSAGRRVSDRVIRAGDLLFFATEGNGATHVGIAVGPPGGDEFVHAPGERGVVRLDHLNAPYWRARFVGVRRLFPP